MARIFDLHVHTTNGSSDSSLSPEEMVQEAERLGLRGLCLTEHSGPWDRHEFEAFAKSRNLVLIRGMEADTDMGHVLAFGLDRYQSGMEQVAGLRRAVDEVGGFIVTAHPFRGVRNPLHAGLPLLYKDGLPIPTTVEEAASHPVFKLVDAVEVANGGTVDSENTLACQVASHLGIHCTGGSDAHSATGLGKYVTVFEDEVNNEQEFLTALRGGHYYPATWLSTGRLGSFPSYNRGQT